LPSLFSSFDPVSSILGISLNWQRAARFLFFFSSLYFLLSSKINNFFSLILSTLRKEIIRSLGETKTPGLQHFVLTLFVIILFWNLLGLLPYSFTASRHLTISVRLALPIWIGYMLYSSVKNVNFFLAHLVPLGTPQALIPFIVFIELVRGVMRPLTLSVRLTANMVAGHLLIILISSPLTGLEPLIFLLTISALILLTTLEFAVSIIQSYVFITLTSLYIIEVNSPNY